MPSEINLNSNSQITYENSASYGDFILEITQIDSTKIMMLSDLYTLILKKSDISILKQIRQNPKITISYKLLVDTEFFIGILSGDPELIIRRFTDLALQKTIDKQQD